MDHRLDPEASHTTAGRTRPDAPGTPGGRPRPRPTECDIRLNLPARAENVALIRHVLGALAEALRMPPAVVEDVKLAVTEACTNVVRHAYDDVGGPLQVEVEPTVDGLTVIVTDRGQGMHPNPAGGGPGLGLPLIAALASQVEIEPAPVHGSRLRMSFAAGDRVGTA